MPNIPDIPHFGSAYPLTRFFLRLAVLCVFAALSSQGFSKALTSLLTLSMAFCLCIAAIRREQPFGPTLTHFDEAAAYGVIVGLATWAW